MNIRKLFALAMAIALSVAVAPGAIAQTPPPIEERPFPFSDGPFSGALAIIPEAELTEFDKPFDQGPHISLLHAAKVDEVVAIKVLFVGPKVDADGNIDVTYDLKILGPNGKLYGEAYEGLEAIRYKVGSAGGVFDNVRAIVKLSFEPGDVRGVYRFVVTLHDNVGDRHIPMTADLEFKD